MGIASIRHAGTGGVVPMVRHSPATMAGKSRRGSSLPAWGAPFASVRLNMGSRSGA